MVVGRNGIRPRPKLKGEDVVFVGISMSIGGIEEINCAWENINVLLNIFIGGWISWIPNSCLDEVSALGGWIVESIVIKILGGDVYFGCDWCADFISNVVDGNCEWSKGVGTEQPHIVDLTPDRQVQLVTVYRELIGELKS